MAFFLGIDIGSFSAKGILLRDRSVQASFSCLSGGDYRGTAQKVRDALLSGAGLSPSEISYVTATGYGAKQVLFADEEKPDIICQGRGVAFLLPSARTVIDVGDLYSKVLRMDSAGHVHNFILSGKCAGGSGRLLQIMAKVLRVNLEDIGPLSLNSRNKVDFSTGCVVFSESEAVSLIAEGVSREDLLAGVHRALAAQIHSLAERVGIEEDLVLTGGGATDAGLIMALEDSLKIPVRVPPEPLFTAALGAALLAREKSLTQGA
ncbi:MAG: acyl-CoA dehydratase activase [Syntrophus sp. (in: bacteria)]|nr:acyl-CoA dehydratase activase [Syntrophus sp. (in: bacteria)]